MVKRAASLVGKPFVARLTERKLKRKFGTETVGVAAVSSSKEEEKREQI